LWPIAIALSRLNLRAAPLRAVMARARRTSDRDEPIRVAQAATPRGRRDRAAHRPKEKSPPRRPAREPPATVGALLERKRRRSTPRDDTS
jgi:hypothetical protein